MDQTISWVATAATIAAASITASNLGSRITGYGFVIFTVGSIAWLTFGLMSGQPALVWTNVALTFLNLFGVWRWLGRQARIEEGAKAGAEDSHRAPGEDLFALSMLAKAPLTAADGAELGRSVDAMAGCSSGRLHYLVVSEGGMAGVGETLRRLPWRHCRVEDDRVIAAVDSKSFGTLERIEPDHWPGR
jgi:hypothetical protein